MKNRIYQLSVISVIVLLINTNSYCLNNAQTQSSMSLVSVEGYITDCNDGTGISNVLVETQYSNGDKSYRAYSNIFSRELDNIVNFTITTCDGSTGDSAEVRLEGNDFPFQNISLPTDTNGVVVFDSVIDGSYNIVVVKVGYEINYIDSVDIYSDTSFLIEMDEEKFLARNLFVDSLTAVAFWEAPLIEALKMEGFENEEFPPSGWETYTLNSEAAEPWLRTNVLTFDGYNKQYNIPPQLNDGSSTWYSISEVQEFGYLDNSPDSFVTPSVDLRGSENYILTFDTYYELSTNFGLNLILNWSDDNGETWELVTQFGNNNYQNWEKIQVDLTPFSGINNNRDSIRFRFYNLKPGWEFGIWCIDNVSIHDGYAEPLAYNIYLNDSLVSQINPEFTSFTFNDLVFGAEYTAKVRAVYTCGLSEEISYTWTSDYLYPPRNLEHNYAYNTDDVALIWNPPAKEVISSSSKEVNDTTLIVPDGLIAFNIYRNGEKIANKSYDSQLVDEEINYIDEDVIPGLYKYKIAGVYDLTPYGFAGDTAESMPSNIDSLEVIWGDELPFFEDWESSSFETQNWEENSENWQIVDIGDDNGFVAKFSWSPVLDSVYYESITTTFMNADSVVVGNFYVDYNIKLDDVNSTGTEYLILQIKETLSADWISLDTIRSEGTFDWIKRHIPISVEARCNVFQIRFVAAGSNSSNISSWYIDNVNIYNICDAPEEISSSYFWNADDEYGISLCWEAPVFPGPFTIYKHWDSGENFSGIGVGKSQDFITGARWDADMLDDLEGYSITSILFYLCDDGVIDITVKVWEGAEAENLIYEQFVTDVESEQFTEVQLESPVLIDNDKELWIGYYIHTSPGSFAAGVDAGPAVTGYGDKISLDGYSWDNLSDFGLDYNWNLGMKLEIVDDAETNEPIYFNSRGIITDSKSQPILGKPTKSQAYLNPYENTSGFNIYLKEGNQDEYQLFDFVPYNFDQTSYCKNFYAEDEVQSGKCYSFQITSVKVMDVDSCESDPGLSADGEDYTYACVTKIEQLPLNLINVYPNPANEQMKITTQENINEVTIINYLGQKVYEINGVESKKYIINSSKFPIGIYIVNIKTSSREYSRKVVIAR
ncbi:MAG: hypothetical protein C0595_12375 [Marinilabiliales bacterium]|nr:MAG: hypothetical protein C0595_12375 [Marinilabiliales bacterium]